MATDFGDAPQQPSIPVPTSSNLVEVAESLKEIVEVWQGARGDGLDKALTMRDLLNGAVIDSEAAVDILTNSGLPVPATVPTRPTDSAIPPTPDELEATGAIKKIVLTWKFPIDYTRLARFEVWRSATDALGDAALIAEPLAATYADEVGAGASFYYWVRAVSDAGTSPYNAVAGTHGSTSLDVTHTVDILAGQISETELTGALGARIDLIDAPDTTPGSVAAQVLAEATARAAAITAEASARGTAISAEATQRETADDALALQVSLLTAGVAGAFDAGKIWYFDGGVEGWTSAGATQAANAGWVDVTSTGTDPGFVSPPALAISGATYTVVKARIKRLAGSGWDGTCFYTTAGHGIDGSHYRTIDAPVPFDVGDTAVVEFAMDSLTAGGTDWVDSTIGQIRLDFGATSADVISVDWVAVGRNAPGASVAALAAEQLARVSADNAEAAARLTLAATVSDNTAAIATESTARASADDALSTQLTALSATVDDNTAAIVTESSARADADSAMASNITTLSSTVDGHTASISEEISTRVAQAGYLGAQYTFRLDLDGIVGGYGVAGTSSDDAGATIDFAIRSNKFYIVPPAGVSNVGAAAFTYLSAPTTVNGVARPAGLYVSDVFIGNGVISNAKIGDAAVDTAKIADAAITTAKIGDAQITTAKIIDAQITTAKIIDAAVNTAKIGDAAVTTAKIGDAQITAAKIGDAQITAAKIANAAVGSAQIDNAAVTQAKIANAAVGSAQIADASITQAKISNVIYSDTWVSSGGASGWLIGKDGTAIFQNAVVRGDVRATSLTANAVTTENINGEAVTVARFVDSSTVVSLNNNPTDSITTGSAMNSKGAQVLVQVYVEYTPATQVVSGGGDTPTTSTPAPLYMEVYRGSDLVYSGTHRPFVVVGSDSVARTWSVRFWTQGFSNPGTIRYRAMHLSSFMR